MTDDRDPVPVMDSVQRQVASILYREMDRVYPRLLPDDHDPVLGYCPHGVDLDRDFCPEGCRV